MNLDKATEILNGLLESRKYDFRINDEEAEAIEKVLGEIEEMTYQIIEMQDMQDMRDMEE